MTCTKCGYDGVSHAIDANNELVSACVACGYATSKPLIEVQRLPFDEGKICPQCGQPAVSTEFHKVEQDEFLLRRSHCGFTWKTDVMQ